MAARRTRAPEPEIEEMPISTLDAAIQASDDETLGFDALKALMDTLNAEDAEGELSVPIYTRKSATSSWSLIDTWRGTVRTFNLDRIIGHIQSSFGNGEYKLTPRVKGRIVKHIPINIGDPRQPPATTAAQPGNDREMFALLMATQQRMADQQIQAQRDAQQANRDFMGSLITAAAPIVAAMLARQPADPMANVASLISALKPEVPQNGLKEAVETMAALKALLPGAEGGGGDDSLMGLAAKLGPDLIGTIREAVKQNPAAAPQTLQSRPVPAARAPTAPQLPRTPLPPPMTPERRLVAMIAPLVLQLKTSDTDPEVVADAILDLLHKRGVPDNVVLTVASKFIGTDTLGSLAALGLDLRDKPQWANAVIDALVAELTAPADDDDDPAGRGSGSATDAGFDGGSGAAGVTVDESEENGG